ncbi:MAG: calcium/sodium antiporter [Lachnospiraceae bacterium]|nr:calcium/sodium antiporter [Lachnospiraceae bacterium]
MEVLKAVCLLIIGFVLLIKGADFFVDGASSVAKKLKVPSLIIGMTIVAMGTSLPELSVSVTAGLSGKNALAISNVIGSNIFNLMVVLGAAALIAPLNVEKTVLKKDYPFSVICAVLLLGLGFHRMELGRIDGAIFLVIFLGFLVEEVRSALSARKKALAADASAKEAGEAPKEEEIKEISMPLSILFIVGGAVAVKFGGDFVVNGAVTIATFFGLSENLIGLTIVALGTSLPELVTSVVAAKKGELEMAIGNVVGSNVFNILMILGVASVLSPIPFIMENVIDIAVLLGFSLLTWLFCITRKKIDKAEGGIMLLCYIAYLVYICMR